MIWVINIESGSRRGVGEMKKLNLIDLNAFEVSEFNFDGAVYIQRLPSRCQQRRPRWNIPDLFQKIRYLYVFKITELDIESDSCSQEESKINHQIFKKIFDWEVNKLIELIIIWTLLPLVASDRSNPKCVFKYREFARKYWVHVGEFSTKIHRSINKVHTKL